MPDTAVDCSSAKDIESGDGRSNKMDCHSIVKSSGLSAKKRLCCDHGHKCTKILKASVACQTDPNENDLDYNRADADFKERWTFKPSPLLDPFNPLNESIATNASYDQQTVAQELCHAKDDDGSKPEGILRLMIHNFRNMNDTVRGPAKLVSGVPWKIMVMPRQHVVAKKGTQKCLGFFLQCCPESYSDSWSCQAAAELRLISQKHGVPNFVRKTNHIYTAKENDWGYSCFMTWADILDESQGYMKEESVILEVFVKAESPKGILTYEAFCKKIQDYMRLSDMQCSRNLIDKALEVNQTALKFCKDKDEAMKEELEKQKTRLIERKLMQSIERIEKGDSKGTEGGESGTNLNNLRQALAGNLASYKNNAATAANATKNASTTTPATQNTNNNNSNSPPAPNNKDSNVKVQKPKQKTDSNDVTKMAPTEKDDTRQEEVKTSVDNLVDELKLSDETKRLLLGRTVPFSAGVAASNRHRHPAGTTAVELFDLNEPCCSDQSDDDDDDDSDYEDIDEVCDGCLVERLDHMSGLGGANINSLVDAHDMCCQTDFQPLVATVTPQATPLLQNAANMLMTATGPTGNKQLRQAPAAPPPSPKGVTGNDVAANAINKLSPPMLKSIKQKFMADYGGGKTLANNLNPADNEELLKLITTESKASLNTIKDTLERLLSHDAAELTAEAPLPFDLAGQLQQQLNVSAAAAVAAVACVKTDVIDIAQQQPQTPAATDSASPPAPNLTSTTTTPPAVPPTTTTTTNAVVTMTATTQPPQPTQTAQSVIVKKTLQQQQQLMDVNQQMVQIKQIVEFKRQQQQQQQQQIYRELTAAAVVQQRLDDEVAQQQQMRQQLVQTDLTYQPRAASPITEEDYTLLRHAKEIVENRAEEFSRYSQIIEKSEYDRLAETVKKVEKRMRDIEKQTMTCRKQLADENERNYREEQKLIKANKQLKTQLDQANEKVEKLNVQLRERRAEIKKMEKKLKVECQTSAENAELNSKIEQLERDLTHVRQKHNEDKLKLTEENHKLNELKKSLQQELSCATNEIERLHAQLEDKASQLKKNETTYKQDRHQAQNALKEASDRAKKAEMNLLEFKLEIFSKTLQRSHDECKNHIGQLEELYKKVSREQQVEDFKWLQTYVQDWQKVKDKIHDTLQKMKMDFSQQVESVKCGKSLTSLPVLDLPKPIPFPPTPKQFHALIHEPKQPIAPIGIHPGTALSATNHQKNRSFSPNQPSGGASGGVMVNGTAQRPISNSGGVVNGPVTGGGGQQQQTGGSDGQNTNVAPNDGGYGQQQATGGSNSASSNAQASSGGGSTITTSQTGMVNHQTPSLLNAGHALAQQMSANVGRQDFTPWSDPLQGLTQSLFGNKPMSAVFDGFTQPPPSAQLGPLAAASMKQAPPPHMAMHQMPPPPLTATPAQWTQGGWAATFSTPPPPIFGRMPPPLGQPLNAGGAPPQPTQPPQTVGGDVANGNASSDDYNNMRGGGQRGAPPGTIENNSPQPSLENTMDSPIGSDKSKQVDVIVEQLRAMFPHLGMDIIRDCMNEFRSMQYNRTLKGLTGEQVFNGVLNVIYSRHKPQASGWPLPPNMAYTMAPPDAGGMNQYGASQCHYDPLCTLCGHNIRNVEMCTLNCSHSFHNNCITPWLAKKPNCPVCCTYTVPAEEFPDLA